MKYNMKENSRDLSEQHVAILDKCFTEENVKPYEFRNWQCNKNMITCYYNNEQSFELIISRTYRVSTRKKYTLDSMTERKSGYGLDSTIKCADEKEFIKTVKDLIKKVDSEQKKAQKEEQKKAQKKEQTAEKKAAQNSKKNSTSKKNSKTKEQTAPQSTPQTAEQPSTEQK